MYLGEETLAACEKGYCRDLKPDLYPSEGPNSEYDLKDGR